MKILFLIATLVVCGCNVYKKRARESVKGIVYSKDHRTGLCFGAISGYQKHAITIVPCEKVEHLIK